MSFCSRQKGYSGWRHFAGRAKVAKQAAEPLIYFQVWKQPAAVVITVAERAEEEKGLVRRALVTARPDSEISESGTQLIRGHGAKYPNGEA
mgnify:CR=1 FL=1